MQPGNFLKQTRKATGCICLGLDLGQEDQTLGGLQICQATLLHPAGCTWDCCLHYSLPLTSVT